MLDTYNARLDRARSIAFADQRAIATGTCVLSREGGQAIEALILLTLPGATDAQRQRAFVELEEFLAAGRAMLPLIAQSLPVTDTS